ncbi:MAG TPA: hypothetical protein VFZ49_07285 [Pyrinomonadaceae bacterium]
MELHLNVIGILLILLALVHGVFPKYFDWSGDLASISLFNRQLIYVHTFFIALVLLQMGTLCLTAADEMISTPLGRKLALGLAVFWTVRLGVQFFGYSSVLWRGKTFETTVHVLFSILWVYLSTVFFLVYWYGKDSL